jgi:uncharacterized protein with von Willebrand factor type A (vWA) domain
MDDINKQLDEILAQERGDIDKRLEESRQAMAEKQQAGQAGPDDEQLQKMLENMAAKRQQQLDAMPPNPAGRIKELQDYDFMSPQAREQFQELLAQLQQQMLNQQFKGLQQSMQNMSPEQRAEMRNMLHDLNQMLEDRAAGKEPKFQEFKEKYGHFFPPNINSLDELMEHLAAQMQAMDSMMQSMSADQRSELQNLMQGLMRDEQLQAELSRLAENLGSMMPTEGQRYPFSGDDPVTLQQAMSLMEQLQQMEELENQLDAARYGNSVDNIDADKMADLVGAEEAQALRQLQELAEMLEQEGYLENNGGKMELTPRAIRKIGQNALSDIFKKLEQDRVGRHQLEKTGVGHEREFDTKPYEFGDPFNLHIERTLRNAVTRAGSGTPVKLTPEDFEVERTEQIVRSSTVLMLDLSLSMPMRENFLPAKKVAMALHSLISSTYPRDYLGVVTFSEIAHEIKPERLPEVSWDFLYGTNMHHGFMLARSMLAKQSGTKQIIMITDGEPTAHVMANGEPFFSYPPVPETIELTLREVMRCTRDGIRINTFMLDATSYLTTFVEKISQLNGGRAFFTTNQTLGDYVLVDFVEQKRKMVRGR